MVLTSASLAVTEPPSSSRYLLMRLRLAAGGAAAAVRLWCSAMPRPQAAPPAAPTAAAVFLVNLAMVIRGALEA